jgi:von Willebrand factor type A domain-containing protein
MGKFRLAAFILLILLVAGPAFAKTDIEFILDASGSMREAMGASNKMDVAKQSIKSALETVTGDSFVALRVYAHRVEQSDKAGSCVDTELLVPFGPLDKAAFGSKVDSIQPKGYTPIAFSLQQAASDFGTNRESDHVIILASDGEETCGGDPVQAVKDLIAKGFKVKVNTIGINVDSKAQAQLQAVAAAGGGQYFDAKDAASLGSSLQKLTQEALLIQKTTATYGSEIKGGDSYETAVAITPGTEYHLNHHQRINQFDYFYVDLKNGQQLSATVGTLGKGVVVQGTQAIENANPYAGMQVHDSTRNRLKQEEIIGGANATKTITVDANKDQRYYVLIGSTYDNMNKECPFKVEVKDFFDNGTQQDAGDTFETAMTADMSKPINASSPSSDPGDVYKFVTTKGQAINLTAMLESQATGLNIKAFDDLHVQLAEAGSPNNGAGFRMAFAATGPVTFIRVQRRWPDDPGTKYTLTFEGAPPAAAAAAEGGATTPAPTAPAPPAPTASPIPASAPAPAAAPAPQVTEKIVEKVVEKPVNFSWFSAKGMKGLGIAFGVGLVGGLIGGFMLGRPKKKPETAA